jgi:hypothetical protein
MRAPEFQDAKPVTFGDVQYHLIVVNPGAVDGFVAGETEAYEWIVAPDSSATTRKKVLTAPRLLSSLDRQHWRMSGRPSFVSSADRPGAMAQGRLPAGVFTFAPHGQVLTFRRVRALAGSRMAVRRQLAGLLEVHVSGRSIASLSLRQYGFLLAAAPLRRATRAAILEAMGMLRGIHRCGTDLFPKLSRYDDAFCVNGVPTSTEVLIDRRTGVADVVCDRLGVTTPLYPNLRVGSLVAEDTFSIFPARP